jgi:hypothetical protein
LNSVELFPRETPLRVLNSSLKVDVKLPVAILKDKITAFTELTLTELVNGSSSVISLGRRKSRRDKIASG